MKKFTSFCQVLKEKHAKENRFLFPASRCINSVDKMSVCCHFMRRLCTETRQQNVQYCDVELQTAAEQSDGEYVSKYRERKCAENYNK